MGGAAAGIVDPNLAVTITVVVAGLASGLLTVIGVIWRGFVWLDRRMDSRISGWSESAGFRSAVREIVSQASHGWSDLYNRQLEDLRRADSELRKRDEERAEAVKRLHGRMDDLWKEMGK
jgi:hypothetical protein